MSCRRISVKGEAEEIAVSRRPTSRQKHGKRLNPFSTQGLEKFESVYAELSVKREYIARKTGAPKAFVRFVYSKSGWIPVVVGPREGNGKQNGGAGGSGASILGPGEKNNGEDGELKRKDERNDSNDGDESISISGFDERSHRMVMLWSQFLNVSGFGVLGLSAMWVRNPRNPKTSQNGGCVEEIAEQKGIYKLSRRTLRPDLCVSESNSSMRAHVQPIKFSTLASLKPKNIDSEHKHHHSKAKKFRRVVSMGNGPTRTTIPQGSESFYNRTSPTMANDVSVGGTVMIITLLCLIFYGQLYASFLASALWYLLPMLVEQRIRWMNRNNSSRMVDLQSNEYKIKVVMDGLLERKHK